MSIGQIVQVIGAVVDIEFPRDAMPKIYEALVLKNDEADSLAENGLTFEVEQQLGDGVVRTIAMGTSEGLRRGMRLKPPAKKFLCRLARRPLVALWTCSAARLTTAVRSVRKRSVRFIMWLRSLMSFHRPSIFSKPASR